jgi:hypothetical protein
MYHKLPVDVMMQCTARQSEVTMDLILVLVRAIPAKMTCHLVYDGVFPRLSLISSFVVLENTSLGSIASAALMGCMMRFRVGAIPLRHVASRGSRGTISELYGSSVRLGRKQRSLGKAPHNSPWQKCRR